MPVYAKLHFTWIPGENIDSVKLDRMKANFPKPAQLPPVAWFMSGVEYYETVADFPDMQPHDIEWYLQDTTSGMISFGRLKIWVDWFHHMLPYLIDMEWKGEHLAFEIIEWFYRVYPNEMYEEYLGFHNDIFHTLMKLVMHERYWKNGDLTVPEWVENRKSYKPEWYKTAGSPLYASMQFCVKYLPEKDMPEWVKSVADIRGKIFKVQVRHWLKDLRDNPSNYNIPADRIEYFFNEMRKYKSFSDF